MEYILSLFAAVIGGFVGWFIANKKTVEAVDSEAEARERLAVLETQEEERAKSLEREKQFFEKSLSEMENKFKGMAQSALRANNEQFLQNTDLKLAPLSEALKKLENKTGEMEKKRSEAYGQLSEQIKGMLEAAGGMVQSSERMQSLLKGSSQVRGNWGEMLLRNVVEFAGMEEHVHFNEQVAVEEKKIPDMVILLPGGAGIPVDSKCPFDSYELARNESDPEKVRDLMTKHAKAVKTHFVDLGRRDYSSSISGDIDFTIMFMPGDHLLEAALAVDPALQDEALRKKILITNPVSLVALLRTVRVYWRQEDTNKNARQIADAAKKLYERCCTWMEHFGKIGKGLKSAGDSYNKAVGSFEHSVQPAGREVKELNVPGLDTKSLGDEKTSPKEIPNQLRELGE
ncbi:MAG TPA: DNA recombination protein RmuC [Planctomycetota bacterium]|jgi:DNA recombination protein RmuC|nr:DNA recombination protein RmuC [Planctomycetota bacterium]HJM38736.1 DNA recombination protein RmuC [Planctomycetota bacterium]|tara:strand:+ start:40513 stop:41715 length:1203 start_codon:yes stop_codon:yes gene_type:complete